MEPIRMQCIDFLNESYDFKTPQLKRQVYYKLEEGKLLQFTNATALAIFKRLMKFESSKKDQLEFINDSKGDISLIKGIDLNELKDYYLQLMKSKPYISCQNKEIKSVCSDLVNAIGTLQQNQEYFKQGYLKNNYLIQMMYRNIVVTILCTSGYLLTNVFELNETGFLVSVANKTEKSFPKNYAQFLSQLSDMTRSNSFTSTLKNVLKPEMTNNKDNFVIISTIAIGVFGIIAFVKLLRLAIYQFYYQKEKLAKYLEANADYIEANAEILERRGASKEVVDKQKASAAKLRRWATKLSSDQQEANSKSEKESSKETDEVSDKDNQPDDDSNSGSNDGDLIF